MKIVKIITNTLGDGDWFEIWLDDKRIEEGHSLSLLHWAEVLERIQGYDKVEFVEVHNGYFDG